LESQANWPGSALFVIGLAFVPSAEETHVFESRSEIQAILAPSGDQTGCQIDEPTSDVFGEVEEVDEVDPQPASEANRVVARNATSR